MFLCCPLFFEFSVGIGVFVIGLSQISFVFSCSQCSFVCIWVKANTALFTFFSPYREQYLKSRRDILQWWRQGVTNNFTISRSTGLMYKWKKTPWVLPQCPAPLKLGAMDHLKRRSLPPLIYTSRYHRSTIRTPGCSERSICSSRG